MLVFLTPTEPVPCDICSRHAGYVAVNTPQQGFVSQLCPRHLASFLQEFIDRPEEACEGLPGKKLIQDNQ